MKRERQLESLGQDSTINTKPPGSSALPNPANLPLPTFNPKPDLRACRDAHQALPPTDVPGMASVRRGRGHHVRSQGGLLVFDGKKLRGDGCLFRFEVCVCVYTYTYTYIHTCMYIP